MATNVVIGIDDIANFDAHAHSVSKKDTDTRTEVTRELQIIFIVEGSSVAETEAINTVPASIAVGSARLDSGRETRTRRQIEYCALKAPK